MIRNSSQNKKKSWRKPGKRELIMYVRGERIVFLGPNMNTNVIQIHIFGQIRIQIIFGFWKWPNTYNIEQFCFEVFWGAGSDWPLCKISTLSVRRVMVLPIRTPQVDSRNYWVSVIENQTNPLIPFPELWECFFSFPSRSWIVGMDFFHSLPIPEFAISQTGIKTGIGLL